MHDHDLNSVTYSSVKELYSIRLLSVQMSNAFRVIYNSLIHLFIFAI